MSYTSRINEIKQNFNTIEKYLKDKKQLNFSISVFTANDVIFLVNIKYDDKLIVTYHKHNLEELPFIEFLNKFDLTSYDKQKLFRKILNCIQKEKLKIGVISHE